LAAPESAADATAGSAVGSLLALGLPTSATAAIMLAAFQQYGMQVAASQQDQVPGVGGRRLTGRMADSFKTEPTVGDRFASCR
jgi:Tripartite tricarboxylate transporter TctA family